MVAGLGSAGRRHLANLRALGWRKIRLYRSGHSTLPDGELAGLPAERDLTAALARRPLAVIVSNPSALHLPVALAAARAGAHLLVEKPLSHDLDGIAELEVEAASRDLKALVGFHLRFDPGLRQVKRWIDGYSVGNVVSANVHWGEYLPDMHPWEDYRDGYAARTDLGGGVLLTLCHPFDYLRWLLGEVRRVSAIEARRDDLDISVECSVDTLLEFESGAAAHVHLDFVQRPPDHRLLIVGTEGTIAWSHADHAARRYSPASKRWEIVPPPEGFERNTMFLKEMQHFLRCVSGGGDPECTLQDGREALEIALAAKSCLSEAVVPQL